MIVVRRTLPLLRRPPIAGFLLGLVVGLSVAPLEASHLASIPHLAYGTRQTSSIPSGNQQISGVSAILGTQLRFEIPHARHEDGALYVDSRWDIEGPPLLERSHGWHSTGMGDASQQSVHRRADSNLWKAQGRMYCWMRGGSHPNGLMLTYAELVDRTTSGPAGGTSPRGFVPRGA
jgi:hypothetical protein